MSKEFLQLAKNEIKKCIFDLNDCLSDDKADNLAENILKLIDWSNSALMHKGFYYLTSTYLKKNNLL